MSQVNQGNIAQYQEKTSYFVRYSSIWGVIACIIYICKAVDAALAIRWKDTWGQLTLHIIIFLVLFAIAKILVINVCKVLKHYSTYVDQSNATEYKVACDWLGCVYQLLIIIQTVGWGITNVPKIWSLIAHGKITDKKTGDSTHFGFWETLIALTLFTISYLINVAINCWLYGMYKNHAKPLIEFYMMDVGGLAAKGI